MTNGKTVERIGHSTLTQSYEDCSGILFLQQRNKNKEKINIMGIRMGNKGTKVINTVCTGKQIGTAFFKGGREKATCFNSHICFK